MLGEQYIGASVQAFFAILSGTFGFVAAISLLFNWFDLITKFQLKRNVADRDAAFKIIDKSEQQFQKHFDGKKIKGNFYLIGALYGIFTVQRVNATLYDKMHQALRRSFDLHEYSLQEHEGLLSRSRVNQSFYDIHYAILKRHDNNEQRDLRIFTFWMTLAAFIAGTLAAVL